jgi:hypothetical protein
MRHQVTLRQAAARSTAHRRLPLLLALLLALGPCAAWAAAPSPAGAETVANAAGRYDGLVLRDLGGKRAVLVCLIAANGAFTPVELWRSKTGAFDTRKARFLSGDVNGDGIADGIALYDLGAGRSRLSIWLSDGHQAVLRTAWTSKAGAFSWARAKLAVGDLDRDGKDDVIALYDRGRGAASLYRFISTGKAFRQSLGWSGGRGALAASGTQLAAGDFTGDGRADAVVLSPNSATSASLLAFVSGSSTFAKKTFWKGAYAAGRARLTAGDADSDGKCDVISPLPQTQRHGPSRRLPLDRQGLPQAGGLVRRRRRRPACRQVPPRRRRRDRRRPRRRRPRTAHRRLLRARHDLRHRRRPLPAADLVVGGVGIRGDPARCRRRLDHDPRRADQHDQRREPGLRADAIGTLSRADGGTGRVPWTGTVAMGHDAVDRLGTTILARPPRPDARPSRGRGLFS